jgi:gamma-glutamyltranspeptidase / glutathione hydrolase
MSPTIVQKNGRPILSLGAAGGPTIISQTVMNLVNVLDYGMNIQDALAKPRIHHQWKPNELKIESLPDGVKTELQTRGHKVTEVRSMGAAQIVTRTDQGFAAASDPRVGGKAAVW